MTDLAARWFGCEYNPPLFAGRTGRKLLGPDTFRSRDRATGARGGLPEAADSRASGGCCWLAGDFGI